MPTRAPGTTPPKGAAGGKPRRNPRGQPRTRMGRGEAAPRHFELGFLTQGNSSLSGGRGPSHAEPAQGHR
eukprot:238676-Pyramimonas_sp.AAC.1